VNFYYRGLRDIDGKPIGQLVLVAKENFWHEVGEGMERAEEIGFELSEKMLVGLAESLVNLHLQLSELPELVEAPKQEEPE
jgi:hypothetical protein